MNLAVLAAVGNRGIKCMALRVVQQEIKGAVGTTLFWPRSSEYDALPMSSLESYRYYTERTTEVDRLMIKWSNHDVLGIEASIMEHVFSSRIPLFVWGGVRRVFPNMVAECPSATDIVARLAKRCYDPDFQFIRDADIGFPISVDKISIVMIGEEPIDDSGAENATGDLPVARAMECLRVAQQHEDLIRAIMKARSVKWRSNSGSVARKEISGGWKSIGELAKMTYGIGRDGKEKTEPDRRWCDDDSFELHRLLYWMDGPGQVRKWS